MANQTELLNVSDEMKLNDKQQIIEGQEHDEELCSSSLDTTEELYSSSAPDTCGDCGVATKKGYVEILEFTHFCRFFSFENIGPNQKEKVLYDRVTVVVAYRVDTRDTF